MSNYLLDERNRIKKLINAKLAFNKKVVLNAINDLDDVSPTQKLAIMEQITNKKLLPKTSMIQELQKEQMIEDASKPFAKALDDRYNAKIKQAESQQLVIQQDSLNKQIQIITTYIDTLLTHSLAKQTNKGVLSLLENTGKIYQTLTNYNLYQYLSPNEIAKLYAINKNIINKSFFKNKDNIKDLKPFYRDAYNFIINNVKTTPKNVIELSKPVLDNFKKPRLEYPVLSLDKINKKTQTPKKLSKATANKILKDLLYKYNNLTYDNENYLLQLLTTSYSFYEKIKTIPGINENDFKSFKDHANTLFEHIKQNPPPPSSPLLKNLPLYLLDAPLSSLPMSSLLPVLEEPSSTPETPPQEGSGIQKLFNKIKKLNS